MNTLKGWIDEFVASLQAKAILINNVAFSVIDPVTAFASTVFKIFKVSAWNNLNKLGVSMLKSENEIYTFLYNGQNIGQDLSKSQAEEFLKEIFSKIKGKGDTAVKKYLDDLEDLVRKTKLRKEVLIKYINKFELKFHKHFDGEVIAVSHNNGTVAYYKMVGAHNHEKIGKVFELVAIRKPQGVTFENLPNDIPFKGNVEMMIDGILYKKKATSTFFPKNWDIIRVKEEIALVYDKMIKESFNLRFDNNKYKFMNSEGTFKIQIEIDKLGNITNAYPLIN